jgi:hypothetical protein
MAPASKLLFDVNVAYLLTIVLLLAAVMSWAAATVYKRRYEAGLDQRVNRWRWLEYGLTGGLILVTIGLISGVTDVMSLVMIWGLVILSAIGGLVVELNKQTDRARAVWAHAVAIVGGVLPWVVIGVYLLAAHVFGDGLPAYICWLFVSVAVLFAVMAINYKKQLNGRGKWANYIYGERVYLVLSVVTKSALAWQVYAAVLSS